MNFGKSKLILKLHILPLFWGLVVTIAMSACSLDAQILNQNVLLPGLGEDGIPKELPKTASQRAEPDFVAGETVTTGDGVIFQGVFGEISERQVLENGAIIEGVFYD
ncbi:MAG TPA: hypothetical protein VGE46_07490 [Bdellovibrio sp.]